MRVVLVEDDEITRGIVETALREQEIEVRSFTSGDEAVAILDDGIEADLLITDINLPGEMDGWAVAHLYRDEFPKLPGHLHHGDAGADRSRHEERLPAQARQAEASPPGGVGVRVGRNSLGLRRSRSVSADRRGGGSAIAAVRRRLATRRGVQRALSFDGARVQKADRGIARNHGEADEEARTEAGDHESIVGGEHGVVPKRRDPALTEPVRACGTSHAMDSFV